MRITDVSVTTIATGSCRIDLLTDEGLRGSAPIQSQHTAAAESLARELLLDRDPRAVSALWDRLSAAIRRKHLAPECRASLDLACWDLTAQARNEPLWKTLGGARPNVMAYASLRRLPDPGAESISGFRTMTRAGGFRWGCLPLAGDLQADGERLAQLREVLASRGGRVELLADAGGIWPGEAIRLVQALEQDFDIACVKNVGTGGDVLGSRRVADSIKAAVCAGYDLGTEADFQPWLHHGAANIIELDLLRLGVTGAQRVAEAAFGFERPVLLRSAPGNLQVHLAAVLPNCMAIEAVATPMHADAIGGDVIFADGRAQAGIRPGLGLHFAELADSAARGD